MSRIDRYTRPIPVQTSPSEMSPQLPSHPTRINPVTPSSVVLPTRLAKLPLSRSTIAMTGTDFQHPGRQDLSNRPVRASSLILPPSAVSSSYLHGQPKIFPGLVHERSRKTSIRHGSDSENHPASLAGGGTHWSGEIDALDQELELEGRPVEDDADGGDDVEAEALRP